MSKTRLPNLDLVRAIAIMLVLYFHVTQMLMGNLFEDRTFFYLGHHGVTMFFVLSGFLIGGIYYKKPEIKAYKFWLSRFLRTYPPYLIMLLVSWLAVYLARKQSFDLGYLFMLQNFYNEIPYFLVSWSLAVEEHFYIIFALFILFIKNKSIQYYFWLLLFIAPLFLRHYFYRETGEFGFYKTASFLHIDSLALGVIMSYLVYVKKIKISVKPMIFWLLFTLTISCFYVISKYENIYTWSAGNTIANLLIGGLVFTSYYTEAIYIGKNKLIKQIALMAYSLYLVHPLIIHFSMAAFKRMDIDNLTFQYIITLSTIFLTSYFFYIMVEKRSIDLRNKLLKRLKSKEQGVKSKD